MTSYRDPKRQHRSRGIDLMSKDIAKRTEELSLRGPEPCKPKPEEEEDRGSRRMFHPVGRNWQNEKAKLLGIKVERYYSYGREKIFFDKSPPKETVAVRGDGNCFFRAISVIISGSEDEHLHVREAITKHISDHPDMYRTFLMSRGGMNEYLTNMRRPKEWATDVELLATATMLKTVVEVFFPCRVKGVLEFRWQTFKPLDNPEITYPCIYICNKNEHFDPVLDIDPEKNSPSRRQLVSNSIHF